MNLMDFPYFSREEDTKIYLFQLDAVKLVDSDFIAVY
jgi:hypothetical protein